MWTRDIHRHIRTAEQRWHVCLYVPPSARTILHHRRHVPASTVAPKRLYYISSLVFNTMQTQAICATCRVNSLTSKQQYHYVAINQQRQVQSVTIVVFHTRSRHIIARYVYDIAMPDGRTYSLQPLGDQDVDDGDVSSTQLAALDAHIRAHILRLMTTAGVDATTVAETHTAALEAASKASNSAGGKPGVGEQRDEEKSFDVLVATVGIETDDVWVPADGEERWELQNAMATPIKDADRFSETAAISCRMEVNDDTFSYPA